MERRRRSDELTDTLTKRSRGGDFCPKCGAFVRWVRLDTGRWIATDPEPVIYRDDGKEWLVVGNKWDGFINKGCRVWRPGDPTTDTRKGRRIHAFNCK